MLLKNSFITKMTCVLTFALSTSWASEAIEATPVKEQKEESEKVDIQKVSEAFGHLIGKNLDSLGFDFDMMHVIKGMKNSSIGVDSPMNETECVQAISQVQEEAFQKLAANNLSEANAFMEGNAKHEGVVELDPHRLQYKIEKQGEGPVVEEHFSPMIRYTGKFIDGKVFGTSQEDELISLDETIQGFSQGIVGMKEGEKRTLYIHPDLGYGTSGYLPPNSTLIFDIEVLKANATPQQDETMSSIPGDEGSEIAIPEDLKLKAVR